MELDDLGHATLSLPAVAMLLVALSLPARFQLPREKAPAWYGLSADTAGRGLAELIEHRLLAFRTEIRRAPRSPLGMTEQRNYTLQGPFAPELRRSDHRMAGRRSTVEAVETLLADDGAEAPSR